MHGIINTSTRHHARLVPLVGCVLAIFTTFARADIFTPLASYEPSETDLTVTPNAGDAGLSLSIVASGTGGAPTATDGGFMLRLDLVNELDGKFEIRHNWSSTTYDLDGNDELLVDVYAVTPSMIPGIMGVWSPSWNPPDNWQQATSLPITADVWTTVSLDVSNRSQTGLNDIFAFVFENLAGSTGTVFVDNMRLRNPQDPPQPSELALVAFEDHVDLAWNASDEPGLDGYNVYRGDNVGGPFVKLNGPPLTTTSYRDNVGPGAPTGYYYVATQVGGNELANSTVVEAAYNGLTDDALLDLIQESHFRYFWNFGHPNCGLAREGINMGHSLNTVTTGGTGMGLITFIVGAERGYETRADIAARVLQILTFLEDTTPRYHGAWSHHYNGVTGATIAFAGAMDNGGDLVETAFLVEGILSVRQYFDDPVDPVEVEIRSRATSMWEGVEWDWYRRFPGSNILYWHWSPDFDFALNHQVRGYNEAMMVYLLAVASPTHPMPAAAYTSGWAGVGGYDNGNTFYGITQDVGPIGGGPLFFTHYSNLGFDPRYKRDSHTNYFENARNISLLHREYAIDNPNDFVGYNAFGWGLTASFDPFGYSAHSPTNDNGTISPTAAASATPYTPEESLATMRYFYDTYGSSLLGPAGFYDAYHPGENWIAPGYIAIDQGPIAPMIENYRTGLCWRVFMSNPEIRPMMTAIGMYFEVDFDTDGDIDGADYAVFAECIGGPNTTTPPAGCSAGEFADSDLDNDGDVDLYDAVTFITLYDTP
ncbi:MAG TPA: glucoamylase family protein [Phycisphaerae bacterium]|nr:glucoamylase family protein [Phycisphaerae bacterium]